jgi:hypothetical protein
MVVDNGPNFSDVAKAHIHDTSTAAVPMLDPPPPRGYTYMHTWVHGYIYIYIYAYMGAKFEIEMSVMHAYALAHDGIVLFLWCGPYDINVCIWSAYIEPNIFTYTHGCIINH